MKTIFFLLFFSCSSLLTLAQTAYTGKATDTPGEYRKSTYTIFKPVSDGDRKKAIEMMEAVVDIVKEVHPQPIGTTIGPYGAILWQGFKWNADFPNGPYSCYVTIPFFKLFHVNGKVVAGHEYSYNIDIFFNSVRYLLQGNSVQYGNDLIFRAPVPGIPVNGFPKYNNLILVMPPGKQVPWRPATKQEYLENFIIALKASFPGRSVSTGEKALVPKVEQMLASMSASEKKEIAYIRKIKYSGDRQPPSDLSALAWGNRWAGFLEPTDTTAESLVIIDEKFYDKSLPRYGFQLAVIYRSFERASISAAAPTKERLKEVEKSTAKINGIVRDKRFLSGLAQLLGKNGMEIASRRKKETPPSKTVVKKVTVKNIDRIVDSLLKNYKSPLPPMPGGSISSRSADEPPPILPVANNKKLLFAARTLNTKEELVQYIDELDTKISGVLSGTHITNYNDAGSAAAASFGKWLLNRPGESLLLAIKAAKKTPDNNSVINNLATTLSLCGAHHLAMPLYIVCIKKEPGNSTLANNAGQAWLALGDHKQAEQYLSKAISGNTNHHHANNSLGMLYWQQGQKEKAIKHFQNSIRGSFTLQGYNSLKALHKESALKLMNYIRHRYHQPDYINFDKYPVPQQCLTTAVWKQRRKEHKDYQLLIDQQINKYTKLKEKQKPIADSSLRLFFFHHKRGEPVIRPFQPFAEAMVVATWSEHNDRLRKLEKELLELERQRLKLKVEYDSTFKAIEESFEPRLDALGEGNPDPSLDDDLCAAFESLKNTYLLLFAENNEERFKKIIHAHKDYLNDYLYWVRWASFTKEQYELEYLDITLAMLHLLKQVRLTTFESSCVDQEEKDSKDGELKLYKPDCPLPVGLEIPFVVGKITLDCESWGIEAGEGVIVNLEQRVGTGFTIAIGAGLAFHATPQIGSKALDLSPGVDAGAKGQLFITFDGNTIADGGFLWEAEIDVKGVGKPIELKQNYTWALVKGFSSEGPLTNILDKLLDSPPEVQKNKNVNIFNPK